MASTEVNDLLKEVAVQGWIVQRDTNHIVVSNGEKKVTLPKTPSDHRSLLNAKAELRRNGLVIDGRSGGPDKSIREIRGVKPRGRRKGNGRTEGIYEALLHADHKLTTDEISSVVGAHKKIVASALTPMVKRGEVKREAASGHRMHARSWYWLKGKQFDQPVISDEQREQIVAPIADVALVGISDIAAIAGVGRSAVENWTTRYEEFPKPLVEISSGPVFDRGAVEEWLATNRPKLLDRAEEVNSRPLMVVPIDQGDELNRLQSLVTQLSAENTRLSSQRTGLAGLPPEFWEHLGKAIGSLGKVK